MIIQKSPINRTANFTPPLQALFQNEQINIAFWRIITAGIRAEKDNLVRGRNGDDNGDNGIEFRHVNIHVLIIRQFF
jgi:hypothetical protein